MALELGLKAFKDKLPRFSANDTIDFSRSNQTPNDGIAQSLFIHLEATDILQCLKRIDYFVVLYFQLHRYGRSSRLGL